MKTLVAGILAGLAVTPFAGADMPIGGDTLGRLEAVLDRCAQLNPQAASQYQESKKLLIQGATADELTTVRASKSYQDAYEEAKAQLDQQAAEQVSKTCTASLPGKR